VFTDGTATGWFDYTAPTILPSDPEFDIHAPDATGIFLPHIEVTKFSTGENWLFTNAGSGGNFLEVVFLSSKPTGGILHLEWRQLGPVYAPEIITLDIQTSSPAGRPVSGFLSSTAPVPEPASILLLAPGFLTLWRLRRSFNPTRRT
jgi:hypothetical protein